MHVSLEEYEKALVEWGKVADGLNGHKTFSITGLKLNLKMAFMFPGVVKKMIPAYAHSKEAAESITKKW